MKFSLFAAATLVGVSLSGPAAIFNHSSSPSATITDGSVFPYANTLAVSEGASWSVSDVNVTLTFSGGYNSDLYGYLVHDGVTVVLLNRIGITTSDPFGNTSAGFNVTLSDGNPDIHPILSLTSGGTYGPDGRAISPLSSGATFDAAPRQNSGNPLGLFNNQDPNGNWTLYFADVSSGGGSSASLLNSWSLEITAVPEPVNVALVVVGTAFLLGRLIKKCRTKPRDVFPG